MRETTRYDHTGTAKPGSHLDMPIRQKKPSIAVGVQSLYYKWSDAQVDAAIKAAAEEDDE